ncbi:MAG: hypothetical protein WBM83_15045, partial [Flavobacteriaceae bacterium]
ALTMLLKPLWPIAEYIMNYDYIVNVLCENKDKPQLKCNGTCYLAKQLAKETGDQEKNPFEQTQTRLELVQAIYFQSLLPFELTSEFVTLAKKSFNYKEALFSSTHILALIRPPEAS